MTSIICKRLRQVNKDGQTQQMQYITPYYFFLNLLIHNKSGEKQNFITLTRYGSRKWICNNHPRHDSQL